VGQPKKSCTSKRLIPGFHPMAFIQNEVNPMKSQVVDHHLGDPRQLVVTDNGASRFLRQYPPNIVESSFQPNERRVIRLLVKWV